VETVALTIDVVVVQAVVVVVVVVALVRVLVGIVVVADELTTVVVAAAAVVVVALRVVVVVAADVVVVAVVEVEVAGGVVTFRGNGGMPHCTVTADHADTTRDTPDKPIYYKHRFRITLCAVNPSKWERVRASHGESQLFPAIIIRHATCSENYLYAALRVTWREKVIAGTIWELAGTRSD